MKAVHIGRIPCGQGCPMCASPKFTSTMIVRFGSKVFDECEFDSTVAPLTCSPGCIEATRLQSVLSVQSTCAACCCCCCCLLSRLRRSREWKQAVRRMYRVKLYMDLKFSQSQPAGMTECQQRCTSQVCVVKPVCTHAMHIAHSGCEEWKAEAGSTVDRWRTHTQRTEAAKRSHQNQSDT